MLHINWMNCAWTLDGIPLQQYTRTQVFLCYCMGDTGLSLYIVLVIAQSKFHDVHYLSNGRSCSLLAWTVISWRLVLTLFTKNHCTSIVDCEELKANYWHLHRLMICGITPVEHRGIVHTHSRREYLKREYQVGNNKCNLQLIYLLVVYINCSNNSQITFSPGLLLPNSIGTFSLPIWVYS
jgi:hypothetical protein